MANTTFNGPVRSENGFQTVSKNATTGAITVTSTMGTGASPVTAGTGITTGTGTVYESSVDRSGSIIKTSILVDLTGLDDGGTAADIIGVDGGAANCHLGQITAAVNGTIIAGRMTCFEVPAGGDPDIDVYSATESTGVQDTAVTGLTETALVDAGDATLGSVVIFSALPAANEYLYLATGAGATVFGTYTAGKLLIELFGYDA